MLPFILNSLVPKRDKQFISKESKEKKYIINLFETLKGAVIYFRTNITNFTFFQNKVQKNKNKKS